MLWVRSIRLLPGGGGLEVGVFLGRGWWGLLGGSRRFEGLGRPPMGAAASLGSMPLRVWSFVCGDGVEGRLSTAAELLYLY